MKAKILFLLFIQLSLFAQAFHLEMEDKKDISIVSEINSANKEANRLINLWYNGNGNSKLKFNRYDIYPVSIWTKQIENAYEIGFADAWDDARYDDESTYIGAEQYYNETFKTN